MDEDSLRAAKGYLIGQYPLLYETPGSLANLLAAMFIYGFDDSYINDYAQNVEAVTLAKDKEVIVRHFPKENLQFVLIGKAAALREQVRKLGVVVERDIKNNGHPRGIRATGASNYRDASGISLKKNPSRHGSPVNKATAKAAV